MSVRALLIVVAALVLAAGVAWLLFRDSPQQAPRSVAPETLGEDTERGERAASVPAPTRPARAKIRPRSVAEGDDSRPESAPITGSLLVTVVGADGRPIARAGVAPCANDDDFFSGWKTNPERTGPDGTARVGIADASTYVVVTAAGYAPALVAIENRERMRVVLGGDVTLRGKVVVDGAPPATPLTLTLRGYDDPTDAWPEQPRHIVERQGFGEMRIRFETGTGGEFSVRGPAFGTSAAIEIPERYRFADSAGEAPRRETSVICNGEPVVLELVTMKAITGRLVLRSPVLPPGAAVDVRYALIRATMTPIEGTLSGIKEEPFAIPFSEPLDGVEIHVWREGKRHASFRRQERITESMDLGDLVLAPRPATTFRVVDGAGRAVAGARVFADGHVSNPTGPDGTTTVWVPPQTHAIIAGAPRFKLVSVPLPEKLPDVVDVRLERSVTLVVRVRHEDPAVGMANLRVVLAFDVDEAVLPSTGRHEFNDVRGTAPIGGGGSGVQQTRTYAVIPSEDVAVSGFDVGQAVEVRVEDVYKHEILREPIKLGSDDVHAVEMVVRSKPRTVRGTVLDHEGRPLAGAQVGVTEFWKTPWSPRTDEAGKFELDGIFATAPTLAVAAPGHVARTIVIDKSEPITIRLERARHLAATVTGGGAGPFQASVTFETPGGETFHAGPRGERVWWFEAIPLRAGSVRVTRHGGQSSVTPIGADETRVSVAAPE